ncbi:MAG: hypothetical protein GWN18_06565, partial [Thermoplasmata archaeon]|nr:hypothetical protein [Thermoplasmata archaeon]NIS11734.1 hypothetical protein [Thermoplasmata archaeon]NIS19630.1 hypothetical protein [Thermoplasmata archaeon]NIT76798.1 hypothetical protein [Thermoplasmata archaeon]NIU48743.1 hypothetical protein [Thermoplasmata archaeon]
MVHISNGLPGQDTEPSIVSSGGELHVAWSHDDAVTPGNADVHHVVMDASGDWGDVTEELGNGLDRNEKKVKLVDWNGTPALVWQSDGINLRGQVYSDVMLMLHEDGNWGPPLLVSPPGKDTGNVV